MSAPCPESAFQPKDSAKQCPLCNQSFGMTRWKYNCHVCGKIVCDDCTATRMTLPPVYVKEAVRVCDGCKGVAGQMGGRTPGGGRTLGGGGPTAQGTEEEERAKRAAIMAARLGKQPGMRPLSSQAGKRPAAAGPSPAAASPAQPAQPATSSQSASAFSGGGGRTAGGDGDGGGGMGGRANTEPVRGDAPPPGSNPMLEAALRRQQAQGGGAASGQKTDDPERLSLLAQIGTALQKKNQTEPFGLRSMETHKLRMYLRHLQQEK